MIVVPSYEATYFQILFVMKGSSIVRLHQGSISPTYSRGFFERTRWETFFGEWCLVNSELIWWISQFKLGIFISAECWWNWMATFFAKRCAPATFRLAHKGWWNWPQDIRPFWSQVATTSLSIRFPHCVAFWKYLNWFQVSTNLSTSETQHNTNVWMEFVNLF